MIDPYPDLDLSPLDQIRQTEADMLRKTAAARKTAEEILENARRQSEALKREAHEIGTLQGQARYKELISKADEEAQILVNEARDLSDKLRRLSQARMQDAASYAVEFVISVAENGNEK
jgi:flagellar biosynthesis/type III secretory pathway protein FliH